MDDLSPYDRATIGLWQRGYRLLMSQVAQRHLAEAAVHAVLPGLRRQPDTASLFAEYETGAAVDLSLIGSVVPADFPEELRWTVRDAAFWLRWLEITGQTP